MKKRSPLSVVLLSIVTFGIYDLYWLVVTKKVLNEKTKQHTPTIWLLVVPYIILIAGYSMLFVGSIIDAAHSSTHSKPGPAYTAISSGEQLNKRGERRPPQYLHVCEAADGKRYISQGTPKCLGADTFKNDYDSSVSGTVYSSPCKTINGELRYVYVANSEPCPAGTQLVFTNYVGDNNLLLGSSSSTSTTADSNTQLSHSSLYWWSLGLIFVGYISTFVTSIFWFFQFSKAINEYTRGKMNTAVTFLILWLIHLIGVALIQDTFNEMDQPGSLATPTAGPVSPTGSIANTLQTPGPAAPQPPQPDIQQQPFLPVPPTASLSGMQQPQPHTPDPAPIPPPASPATPSEPRPRHPLPHTGHESRHAGKPHGHGTQAPSHDDNIQTI